MFIPSDQACGFVPNSQNSTTPAQIAACQAEENALTQSLTTASNGWAALIDRTWPSFADQGPYVALQLRNGGPNDGSGSGATSGASNPPIAVATPAGVQSNQPNVNPVSGAPSGATFGPSTGSNARGMRNRGVRKVDPSMSDAINIVRYFNYRPPFQVYTGPLPRQGTVKSLVVGGSNRPGPVGPGAPTINPFSTYGYSVVPDCSNPSGVAILPWGEDQIAAALAASGGASSSPGAGSGSNGVMLALVALLGLAGLSYFAEHQEKKKRGHAA